MGERGRGGTPVGRTIRSEKRASGQLISMLYKLEHQTALCQLGTGLYCYWPACPLYVCLSVCVCVRVCLNLACCCSSVKSSMRSRWRRCCCSCSCSWTPTLTPTPSATPSWTPSRLSAPLCLQPLCAHIVDQIDINLL